MRSWLFFLEFKNIGTTLQDTGIATEECEAPDIGVGRNLERKASKRLFVSRMPHNVSIAFQIMAGYRRHVGRRRQIFNDGIKHELHAFVLERGTAEHRDDLVRNDSFAQSAARSSASVISWPSR